MIAIHGGIEGFCVEWYSHILAAEDGSRWKLTSCEAIAKLGQLAATAAQKEQATTDGDVERLSDEEIAAEMLGEVDRLVKQSPSLAVEALRRQGWTVIEPDHRVG